jgi:MFS family permease
VKSANEPEVLYCANHPGIETLLRCNRCNKPICTKCAVLTDVGYRCKECIRGVQASYFNAIPTDNLIGFGVALVVAAIASPIAGFIFAFVPLFFGVIIAFAIGSGAGGALAQIIRASVGRRRGRYLRYFTLAGIILGVLLGGFVGLLFGIPVFSLTTLVFTVLSTITAYQILR